MESGFKVTYSEENNFLMGEGYGQFTEQMIEPYIIKIDRMAAKHDCKRFINNLSKVDIQFSISELFFTPTKVVAKYFDRTWARAIIVKKITDDWKFFETTAKNQGLNVKIFTSIQEAQKWFDE